MELDDDNVTKKSIRTDNPPLCVAGLVHKLIPTQQNKSNAGNQSNERKPLTMKQLYSKVV